MEKFLGSYQALPDLTENLDGYFDAMKIPDEVRKAMKDNADVVSRLLKEGEDSYKERNSYGNNRNEEFTFKLDVPCVTSTMGVETTNTFTLKGDRLDGVHVVGGQTTTSSRYFQGDHMVFEATGNGATMKTYFKKIQES